MRNFLLLLALTLPFQGMCQNSISFSAEPSGAVISKYIYGQFAEHLGHGIYEGVWVGPASPIPNTRGIRNDVVKALRDAHISLIRWPGGCFADEYHWMDGIGDPAKRPSMVNTNWGGVTEDNSFGTHEFMDLCEQVGAEAYVSGNLGSGTVREMSQWMEYMTSSGKNPMTALRKANGRERPWKVRFWGMGNESWGCGGNMNASFYASEMKRYASFCKDPADEHVRRIAVGPNEDNYAWTETLMKEAGRNMDGLSLHYYTLLGGWEAKGSATRFGQAEWYGTLAKTLRMEELLEKHTAIMDRYDPKRRVGLMVDEWGNWFDVEPGTNPGFLYQQNTMRDAVLAAVNLNMFNNHAERVKMTAIAQMVNVLQALVLTHNREMVLTPTYYVFRMYAVHQNARLLKLTLKTDSTGDRKTRIPRLSASASRDSLGRVHVSLANLSAEENSVCRLEMPVATSSSKPKIHATVITSPAFTDYNEFGRPARVFEQEFKDFQLQGGQLKVSLPAHSVITFEIHEG